MIEFKTTHGNHFIISDNKYLEFDGKKIDIKKIDDIGDHLIKNESKTDNEIKYLFYVVSAITFAIGIYFQFNPYIVLKGSISRYDGRSLEYISRIPDTITWIVFVASIAISILYTNRTNQYKQIDENKNDYSLTILVTLIDNPDPLERTTERYELCKGTIHELREIRKTLLKKIEEQRLL